MNTYQPVEVLKPRALDGLWRRNRLELLFASIDKRWIMANCLGLVSRASAPFIHKTWDELGIALKFPRISPTN